MIVRFIPDFFAKNNTRDCVYYYSAISRINYRPITAALAKPTLIIVCLAEVQYSIRATWTCTRPIEQTINADASNINSTRRIIGLILNQIYALNDSIKNKGNCITGDPVLAMLPVHSNIHVWHLGMRICAMRFLKNQFISCTIIRISNDIVTNFSVVWYLFFTRFQ